MTQTVDNSEDVLDSRDIIARLEELQSDRDSYVLGAPDGTETPNPDGWREDNPGDALELDSLEKLAADGESYSEDWEHGAALIRDSYFTEYAQEMLEDCGTIPANLPAYIHIDWEATARDIRVDYTSVEFDGVTYWVR